MTDVQPVVTDFSSSGRTGRRNALPDIRGSPGSPGSSELPKKLENLSLSQDNAESTVDHDPTNSGEKRPSNNNMENKPEIKKEARKH
ncbi:cAMP-dependent protein kinase inhibitor beta [Phascolarctos cinereus]|uniref:cAMP-dependent protein kinase inhibitor beta n=1 Tax=Phascolarctos cinereus TaxID=38626 RepID=A0A6P5KAX0_PHACI|nr:cAMP-dependent protein kinase inhibitor beta [Phascolarctos cinereus]XP_020842626.1 cAMP-dependent protein kinase inhibitor beta [Phascolarctos cinereus]XP_020842627.1 cAMP-dependent protein kinase inhibitor beta [Phascolarctos cinereus]XP_020842628.1 cAMP-dependent protein kinase inhibitor beta [Phascolarctos cinereus]